MYLRKMKIEDYDNVYSLWMSCVGMGLNNLYDSKRGFLKSFLIWCFADFLYKYICNIL